MSDPLAVELIEELDAFDPRWRSKYRSLRGAATAAKVPDLFAAWAATENGKAYLAYFKDVTADYVAQNELTQRQLTAEHDMFVEACATDGIPEMNT